MLPRKKTTLYIISLVFVFFTLNVLKLGAQNTSNNQALHQLFDNYYKERLKLFPLEATNRGDTGYNDKLPNVIAASILKTKHDFFAKYQQQLKKFNYKKLSEQDQISYDILMDITQRELGREKFHTEYMPIAQTFSLPLTMGQLGSGSGAQPFKTVKDYENWLKRIEAFTDWTDTAIANFRKGMKAGIVLPKALVVKIIPQMESLGQTDSSKSIFYGPVRKMPKEFSEEEKEHLTRAYHEAITQQLLPAFTRLKHFLSNEYLPVARTTSGINVLPNGKEMYQFFIYEQTTTRKSADEIYDTGLKEVARITAEMEKIKASIGFKGSLNDLFQFMKTDKRFLPYQTKEDVLNANKAVLLKIDPYVKTLFGVFPKAAFEIREVEAFRAASASPQYSRGTPDGSRPGIYYVPIVDPTKINTTSWALEATFLHEAIPGHHFQVSLQQENASLPKFRRFATNAAFAEGWALYIESLGEQLGCYTDPYQKLGALGNEIHRAIRLVVDAAIHTGKMTREEAIKYMMDHEALSEKDVIVEIERYMAQPGQALSYKTGELKIIELRNRYQKQLGANFSLKAFHDAILMGGSMPLNVFERYMNAWATKQKTI